MPRTPDTKVFLTRLQELGGSAGNKALREKLHWAEEKYFRVRKTLIEEGLVEIGRGQGGSVNMPGGVTTTDGASAVKPKTPLVEADHYPIIMSKIAEQLKHDFRSAVVEQTAFMGKIETGGKWSRPDILAVTFQRFEYVANDEFILRSYEIKRSDVVDADAVAEVASHRRLVEMAYLVVVPHGGSNTIFDPTDSKRRRIEKECLKAGVGLILVPDYEAKSDIDIAIDAEPSGIDYRSVNSTIGLFFSDKKRDEIRQLIEESRRGVLQKLLS